MYKLYYYPFHFNPSCSLRLCRVLEICRKIIHMDRSSIKVPNKICPTSC